MLDGPCARLSLTHASLEEVWRKAQYGSPSSRLTGIREGADADIVVFDAGRVIDRATFREPTRPSEGVRYVLINGLVVVRNGVGHGL
jgi:dihydroorotase-like cyclic amidohydrolase